jgi:hypothetical protein
VYAVSDEYINTLIGSHTRALRASLSINDTPLYEEIPLAMGGSSISVSRTSHIRRSGSVTIADPTFWQQVKSNQGVIPYGAELYIESGISDARGGYEWVPVGVFQIEGAEVSETSGYFVTLELYDRGKVLERNKFAFPVDYSGWMAKDAIVDIIDVPPFLWSWDIDDTLKDSRLPGGTVFEGDRWDAIDKLCELLAAEAYFDVLGNFHVIPVIEISANAGQTDADWTVEVSKNMVNATRSLSRDGIYNAFVVIGGGNPADSLGNPLYGYAEDTEPSSPTNVNSSFGVSLAPTIENSLLTTTSQCNKAAQKALKKAKGLARSVQFEAVENDALEIGDLIYFVFSDGDEELHLVESFELNFSGKMTGTTQTRTF